MIKTEGNTKKGLFKKITEALQQIQSGGMIILVDDEDRENEGDLVFAAEDVTPEKINFMAKEARGLICLSLSEEKVKKLDLPMMVDFKKSTAKLNTAFTVSIEAKEGVTTGISAFDRSQTIKVAINDQSQPKDLVVPGHIFPLKAKSGGVFERAGHTEGSLDLVKLAGKPSGAVICEILNDNGTMARRPDLDVFAAKHNIPILTIKDIIEYRLLNETIIKKIKCSKVQNPYGTFQGIWYTDQITNSEHFALLSEKKNHKAHFDIFIHKHHPLFDSVIFDSPLEQKKLKQCLADLKQSKGGALIYLGTNKTFSSPQTRTMKSLDKIIAHQITKDLEMDQNKQYAASIKELENLSLEQTTRTNRETNYTQATTTEKRA